MYAWPTALFVLLWSSGAIFSRWGLDHASAFVLLVMRFTLALAAVLALGWRGRAWLPAPGARFSVASAGLLMIGGYSCFYFLALQQGLTPGVLATVLGVQPILTLLVQERRFSPQRMLGLVVALAGLTLVVADSLLRARFSVSGFGFATLALVCMTVGTLMQKRVTEPPNRALPLQFALSLLLCLLLLPLQPMRLEWSVGLVVPVIWLGLVISVGATLLLYRLIHSGNLVNVTSLFYLVPGGTALLDWLLLGNRMSPASLVGLATILLGLALVFRSRPR